MNQVVDVEKMQLLIKIDKLKKRIGYAEKISFLFATINIAFMVMINSMMLIDIFTITYKQEIIGLGIILAMWIIGSWHLKIDQSRLQEFTKDYFIEILDGLISDLNNNVVTLQFAEKEYKRIQRTFGN